MSVETLARRPRWAPGPGARIDWSHPLAKNLAVFMIPCGGRLFDLVSRKFADDLSSTSTVTPTIFGQGLTLTPASAARARIAGLDPFVSRASISTIAVMRRSVSGSGDIRFGIWADPGNPTLIKSVVAVDHSTGSITTAFKDSSVSFGIPASPRTVAAGEWATVATTWDGSTVTAYANNAAPTTAALSGVTQAGSGAVGIGDQEASTFGGDFAVGALYQRVLSASDFNRFAADPFCFIIDPTQQVFAFAATTPAQTAAALQGSTGITFANSGTLTTGIPLAGSSAITFANSAALTTSITMAGTSALRFGLSGSMGNTAIGTVQYRFGRARKSYEFGQVTKEPT